MDYMIDKTATDQKMSAYEAQRAYIGTVGGAIESPLSAILRRVEMATERAAQVGGQLGRHADQLFGDSPPEACGNEARPIRSGLTGSIEDALDTLDRTISRLSEQADRNCRLAA